MSFFSEMDIQMSEATEISRRAKMISAVVVSGIDYGHLSEALRTARQAGLSLQEAASTIDILVNMIERIYESNSAPSKDETIAKVRLTATVDIPWYMMDMKVSDLVGTKDEEMFDI